MTLVRGVAVEQVAGDTLRFRACRARRCGHAAAGDRARQSAACRTTRIRGAGSGARDRLVIPLSTADPACGTFRTRCACCACCWSLPVAWLLARGRISVDVLAVRRLRRPPTVSTAFSPSAAAGPRSSARFSIRWPTRFCWSASSSRSLCWGWCRSGSRLPQSRATWSSPPARSPTSRCMAIRTAIRPRSASSIRSVRFCICCSSSPRMRRMAARMMLVITMLGALVFVTTIVSGLDYVLTYSRKAMRRAGNGAVLLIPVPIAQLPLGIRLRDSSVFESFFGGRNQPVVDALLALPRGRPPTCVWLHGAAGIGKTHLLQALALALRWSERDGSAYLPLGDLIVGDAELLSGYGRIRARCIDDAQVSAGRDRLGARAVPFASGTRRARRASCRGRRRAAGRAGFQAARSGARG